jgi:hypothetical protein
LESKVTRTVVVARSATEKVVRVDLVAPLQRAPVQKQADWFLGIVPTMWGYTLLKSMCSPSL